QRQQQRMRDCNAQAATQNLAGAARRTFMQSCLSGQTAAPAAAAPEAAATPAQRQQQRMRDCNAQAGTQSLAGAARQTFMRSCLSGAATTAPAAGTTAPATPRATTPRTPTAPATPPAATTPATPRN
ncbi:PsiF family protein, partial [Plastoroseomonas hellenica]|uniref:PsiF family protein n=1 Tax=Plastoroseomonas hellenica TaxID=2687306 RepID=UPI001BAD6205